MAFQHSGRLPTSWRAYRIADRRHKIFDGQGAAISGGRWNSPGRRVIHAAETFAGAMLEVLVNANIGRMPKNRGWIEILIGSEVSVEEAEVRKIRRWDAPDQRASRIFGDRWYDEQRSTIRIVPSTVVCVERNVVINQEHPDFRKLRATRPNPVIWDERLFQ
jgi:RES domain-containing protein